MGKLAMLGGKKTVSCKSSHWPPYSDRAIKKVARLMREGPVFVLHKDKIVGGFEDAFAKWHGTKYCIAVNSGTGALHSALVGCGIGPGDEVITSPYSWGATTGCILHQGAVPVFADVLERNGLLDPKAVEACITLRTRGIMVVHLYGQPADMTSLRRIAKKHKLALVEDCSQAHGATYRGRPVGTWGDAAGFSCMGGKLLGAIESGAMLTNRKTTYEKALLAGHHIARTSREVSKELIPYADSLVWNYRPNVVACTLLADQLPSLRKWNKARAANRNLFVKLCGDISFLNFPLYKDHERPSYHMATFRYDRAAAKNVARETFILAAQAEGVSCFNYVSTPIPLLRRMNPRKCKDFPPMWNETLERARVKYRKGMWPVAEKLCAKSSLEILFNEMISYEPEHINQMATAMHKIADNLDALREWERERTMITRP